MKVLVRGCILLLGCASPACFEAQAPAAASQGKTEADYRAEAEQVKVYLGQQNFIAALPLLEELHRHDPKSALYDENLALALLARVNTGEDTNAVATRNRARQLLLDAKAQGDNCNLLQLMLEKLGSAETAESPAPKPLGSEYFQQAEKAFSSGDMPGALAAYKKALEVNPKFYEAALYAGDAEYKAGHLPEAGEWYSKAISIDPDRETAYRYWGDALDKSGEHQKAEQEFIQGVLAQPYQRAPRLGLKQWADANHMRLVPPPIKLPAQATPGKNGNINITIQDTGKKDDPEMSINLVYAMNSALWQGEKFKKTFPNEKTYRHSLAEELDGIHTMLSVAKEQKIPSNKLSTSTKLLLELDSKGMLGCWVLLDNPDQGVAQDYVGFLNDHRDLMAKYMVEYDIHPM